MTSKWDKYIVSESSSPSNIISEKWEKYRTKEKPSTIKEIAKEAIVAPISGLVGAYGTYTQGMPRQLPGQEAISKAEATVPESVLPWLQEENIAPQYAKYPTTEEARQVLGAEPPQTMGGQLVKRALTPIGGLAAHGLSPLSTAPMLAGGAIAGQTAQELGFGETGQTVAELLGSLDPRQLAQVLKKSPALLQSGMKELKAMAANPKLAGWAKVGQTQIKKAEDLVIKDADQLISNIKKESISVANAVEKGLPIRETNNEVLSTLRKIAPNYTQRLDSQPIKSFIQEERSRLTKAPLPSDEKKKALAELTKIESTHRSLPFEAHNPEEALAQYRDNNENLRSLYEKKLTEGTQLQTKQILDKYNRAIAQTILKDKNLPNNFKRMFGKSNEIFSKLSKLDSFNNIYTQLLNKENTLDPYKFSTLFRNSAKVRHLEDAIGKEGAEKLKILSDDLLKTKQAIGKIGKEDWIAVAKEAGLSTAIWALLGMKFTLPGTVYKGAQWLLGFSLLRPKNYRNFKTFLKVIETKKVDRIKNAAIRLKESMDESES